MLNSSIYTQFELSLEDRKKTPPLKGFDDFYSKVPLLVLLRMTNCNNQALKDFLVFHNGKSQPIKEAITNGLDEIKYHGFCFHWGQIKRRDSRGIITTMENLGSAEPYLIEFERSQLGALLLNSHNGYPEIEKKFTAGKMEVNERGISIDILLKNRNDRVIGNIKNYWYSYWYGAMKPLLAIIREYEIQKESKRLR